MQAPHYHSTGHAVNWVSANATYRFGKQKNKIIKVCSFIECHEVVNKKMSFKHL